LARSGLWAYLTHSSLRARLTWFGLQACLARSGHRTRLTRSVLRACLTRLGLQACLTCSVL